MLIFNIDGGLGNQMFQYAYCFYLSKKYKKPMAFDLGNLSINTLRDLELDSFQVDLPLATHSQLRKFKMSRYARINYYLNLLLLNGSNYFYEPKIGNRIIADGTSYYWGYWQKPQCIIEIDELIRKLFVLRDPLTSEAQSFKNQIQSTQGESVSIHIRKNDYLLQKNSYFASCDAQYYYTAIDVIRKSKGQNLHFFIFSDDFNWINTNLQLDHIECTFVNPKKKNKPAEDLYLMSICNHNIIANSTYSWWGAYLNNHKDKIIISPKFWFKDRGKSSINLGNWIEVDNEEKGPTNNRWNNHI
jgi:hypothetical protein